MSEDVVAILPMPDRNDFEDFLSSAGGAVGNSRRFLEHLREGREARTAQEERWLRDRGEA